MSVQTTQLTTERSTNGTHPSSQTFWQSQSSWNCDPGLQPSTINRYSHESSSNWLVSDYERTQLISSEINSRVADSSFKDTFLSLTQLLIKSVDQRPWESIAEYLWRGVIGFRVQLAQALEELDQVVDEAQSEGYKIPSSIAIYNAEYIVKCIYDDLLHPVQVYPMPDGEVAIDVTNDEGSSVLILCCSDGGTLCFVNINGNQRRAHYSNSDALPDGFMREALEELQQE